MYLRLAPATWYLLCALAEGWRGQSAPFAAGICCSQLSGVYLTLSYQCGLFIVRLLQPFPAACCAGLFVGLFRLVMPFF